MKKLFGTDGIRGVANEYPMTPEIALNIGRAAVLFCGKKKGNARIIIGKDTRISGDMIESALIAGICSMGGDACTTGILPTPGVAFVASSTDADAGIVISASHNPFYDNGIKFFNQDGYKLSDEEEEEIEQIALDDKIISRCNSIRKTGRIDGMEDAGQRYGDFLRRTMPKSYSLKGLKIVIDCANGATFKIAPEIFADLGAEVEALGVDPDGTNINKECGSQHTDLVAKKVLETGADIGLSLDGDGDRLVAVDEKGNRVTGDQIIAVCAKVMKQKGGLKNNLVVSTVMSNMGLGIALNDMGIKHVTASVGDRYVLKEMMLAGSVLGGEDSGHIIFLDHQTTGDGMLTALKLMDAIKVASAPLSETSKIMKVFPQVLLNEEVKEKPSLESMPGIQDAIKSVEAYLGEKGRVLVRYSGTRPLCRIMVEGPTLEETDRCCRQIAATIREELG
jgi:phosphoglucosamine mutase